MPRFEQEGVRIQTHKDIEGIGKSRQSEREFARLLLDKTNLDIYYESTRFEYQNGGVMPYVTVPDFRVINLITGVETFIEITTSVNGKGKQKTTMKGAAPGTHYVVFHRDKLQDIQDKFPAYNLLPPPFFENVK